MPQSGRRELKSQLRVVLGDLFAGVSTAVAALPGSIVFGLIAFAPLPAEYATLGIKASIIGTVIFTVFFAMLSKVPILISGPKAPTALILAAVISKLLQGGYTGAILPGLVFSVILAAGFFQFVFGFFRLGSLIKWIPHPVMAGIVNGSALLILAGQVFPLLGLRSAQELTPGIWQAISFSSLSIGIVTIAIFFLCKKIAPRLPNAIVALLVGTLYYSFLQSQGMGAQQVAILGSVPSVLPLDDYLPIFRMVFLSGVELTTLFTILSAGLTIAMIDSLEGLLAVRSIQDQMQMIPDGNRELMASGAGNMASAFCGGLSSSGFISRSHFNLKSGARSKLSVLSYAMALLVFFQLLNQWVGVIPRPSLSALMVIMAIFLFDEYSVRLIGRTLRTVRIPANLLMNLAIILLVTTIIVFFDMVTAIIAGVAVSIIVIFKNLEKGFLRRSYSGKFSKSKCQRNEVLGNIIDSHGEEILVFELEGAMLFSSADLLSRRIEEQVKGKVSMILLDMRRVASIDFTGAVILGQIARRLRDREKLLAFSHLAPGSALYNLLEEMGVLEQIGSELFFDNNDWAMEFLENRLIEQYAEEHDRDGGVLEKGVRVLRGMTCHEIVQLRKLAVESSFVAGEPVFLQGDAGDAAFLVVSGVAQAVFKTNEGPKIRLQTFTAGTIFGEMAFTDESRRSATIECVESLTTYSLTLEAFKQITRQHPDIAIKLLGNINQVLSERLRAANLTISELNN